MPPVESLLTRGALQPDAQAIAAAQTLTTDILCQGDSTLVVQVDMTGAANGDLAVTVTPFERDQATPLLAIDPMRTKGPTFAAGRVTYFGEFDVTGIDKVRVSITNNNVGAQVVTRSGFRLA